MSVETILNDRSEGKCELCSATNDLTPYEVQPNSNGTADHFINLCPICSDQIEDIASADLNHWRCLADSMWTSVPVVQVMAWRMLKHFATNGDSWAQDQLDMLYLEDDILSWAQAGLAEEPSDDLGDVVHKDSNGAVLTAGDTVVLIKDLNVKGAGFTAKRGTAVRNISLVPDNANQLEGRVNGQQIVILCEFVKKS